MVSKEFIADRIEEAVGNLFAYFAALNTGATEYSIFYFPQKHSSWFILIFFNDKFKLKEALNNGICYQMHCYLLNELDKIQEGSGIEKSIRFGPGNRPVEKSEIDQMFGLLLQKQEAIAKTIGKSDIKDCGNCGHNFDNHQLLCYRNNEETAPSEGWIVCPEENCNCFQTWSASYKNS